MPDSVYTNGSPPQLAEERVTVAERVFECMCASLLTPDGIATKHPEILLWRWILISKTWPSWQFITGKISHKINNWAPTIWTLTQMTEGLFLTSNLLVSWTFSITWLCRTCYNALGFHFYETKETSNLRQCLYITAMCVLIYYMPGKTLSKKKKFW